MCTGLFGWANMQVVEIYPGDGSVFVLIISVGVFVCVYRFVRLGNMKVVEIYPGDGSVFVLIISVGVFVCVCTGLFGWAT